MAVHEIGVKRRALDINEVGPALYGPQWRNALLGE